jgi:hypothetical protein
MYTWQELVALHRLSAPAWSNLEPRTNVCPADTIDVVIRGGASTRSDEVIRWADLASTPDTKVRGLGREMDQQETSRPLRGP